MPNQFNNNSHRKGTGSPENHTLDGQTDPQITAPVYYQFLSDHFKTFIAVGTDVPAATRCFDAARFGRYTIEI